MKKKYLIKDNEIVYYSSSRGFVTIPKSCYNYKEILDYLLNPNFREEKFLELVDKPLDIETLSNGEIKQKKDGTAVTGDINIPKAILDKIAELRAKGFEWKHYQKFWERCRKNPNPKSVELLFEFLSKYNFTITEDGCFLAYKGIREDFKDVHSGTFDNSPGNIVKMERSDVTFDPKQHCSRGLHCGALAYASSWGAIVVLVKVDPADVVSVPEDHNAQKIRVCRYKVDSVYQQNKQHENTVVNRKNKAIKVRNDRSSKWTKEEEEILWKLASKMTVPINWDSIVKKLKRSKDACRKKYVQLKKNPPVIIEKTSKKKKPVKKKWTPLKAKSSIEKPVKKSTTTVKKISPKWTEQDSKILENMHNSGKGWTEIGKYLGKSADSCRKRFNRINKLA